VNVIEDTLKHIAWVADRIHLITDELLIRASTHDASKLQSPEKEMFEEFRPKLDSLDIKSEEYKEMLAQMGQTLKHHYLLNPHHPECHNNGIRGMTLVDVVEMVCDWHAAANKNNQEVDMEWACQRFGIQKEEMLYSVIQNTVHWLGAKLEH